MLSCPVGRRINPGYTQSMSSDNKLPTIIRGTPATSGEEKVSFLVAETAEMEDRRRLREQQGHRARFQARVQEHSQKPELPQGEDPGESPLSHPDLESQLFDGIDPDVSPLPLTKKSLIDFENERRDQELQKKLALGLIPGMSSVPKPSGPG